MHGADGALSECWALAELLFPYHAAAISAPEVVGVQLSLVMSELMSTAHMLS